MLNRRSFLANASGLAATFAFRDGLFAQLEKAPSSLPDRKLYENNEDAYWSELRKQFLIPEDEVYLNNGTVGSSPAPRKWLSRIWGYAAWNNTARHFRRL